MDGPDPQRTEIDLDPKVVGSGDPMFADDDVIARPLVDDAAGSEGVDQRRGRVIAATVGVLALVLGWAIGRSGRSDEVATIDTGSPDSTEVVGATVLPGETLPSAATTTTLPRRTTPGVVEHYDRGLDTTLALPSVASIEVDPRLTGVELTLVGLRGDGVLVELDLAGQTLTRRDSGQNGDGWLVVGDDWVAVVSDFAGGSITLLRDGEPQVHVDHALLGGPYGLISQKGTDRFWRPVRESEGFHGPSTYEEIDVSAEPTGVTLELPIGARVARADPLGGLIVEVSGKHYSVSESGFSQIAAGDVLGVSAEIVMARECDEQLRCGVFVTDRRTGAVRELELDASGDELRFPIDVNTMFGWGYQGASTISPDGTMCVVALRSVEAPVLGLIDLSSGAVVELGGVSGVPAVEWSPDGRFSFFLDLPVEGGWAFSGSVSVYDRESGEVFPVTSEPLDWTTLAARPTGS